MLLFQKTASKNVVLICYLIYTVLLMNMLNSLVSSNIHTYTERKENKTNKILLNMTISDVIKNKKKLEKKQFLSLKKITIKKLNKLNLLTILIQFNLYSSYSKILSSKNL